MRYHLQARHTRHARISTAWLLIAAFSVAGIALSPIVGSFVVSAIILGAAGSWLAEWPGSLGGIVSRR